VVAKVWRDSPTRKSDVRTQRFNAEAKTFGSPPVTVFTEPIERIDREAERLLEENEWQSIVAAA
jgi:hypothetical protein